MQGYVEDSMETKYYSQNNVEFKIGGKSYPNLSVFLKSLKYKKSGKHSTIFAQKEGFFNVTGYVVEYSEPLPCFDSSDYAYENRYRSEFFFVNSMERAKQLYKDFENGYRGKINGNDFERLSFVRNDSADKTFITYTNND